MNQVLIEKLNPRRFPGMSGKMGAIIGFILGQAWTSPRIVEMAVTSDAIVLAREAGDVGLNLFIGRADDLERNFQNLLEAACLLPDERAEVERLYHSRIQDHRRVGTEFTEVSR